MASISTLSISQGQCRTQPAQLCVYVIKYLREVFQAPPSPFSRTYTVLAGLQEQALDLFSGCAVSLPCLLVFPPVLWKHARMVPSED